MNAWVAVGLFFALPVLAGLVALCSPDGRKVLLNAARHDAGRMKGRLRHPLTRQSDQPVTSEDRPWDGWAP